MMPAAKEAALPVANKGAETPYLLQSWVDNIDGKSRAPFIITPPLFRLEAGDDSSLRIIKTADNLPENKESLFTLMFVPFQQRKNQMMLMLTS